MSDATMSLKTLRRRQNTGSLDDLASFPHGLVDDGLPSVPPEVTLSRRKEHSSLHERTDGLVKVDSLDENGDKNSNTNVSAAIMSDTGCGGDSNFCQTFAGVAGNVLEWYDFAVFGYFSDILGEVFFPPHQKTNSTTTESFLVFGVAFLMRPIGGIMIGYIGDVYGRKKALVASLFLMAFPTFAMGCLPGYAHIGKWAIVLLVLVRLLQGLSVGGQLMSSLVFTLENHDPAQWGLYGSFVMAAANL